jgi:DNA-binding SARP family transcriptional activator
MQLFTLGALDLRSDARDVGAVLAQPKRLGLLAYLASARPYRLHRRDSLLALFWPQLGTMEGRRALRQALHFLRQALGDDSIVSRGETIGLGESVWCDARAFELALGADAPADALALYRGDLLDGFHVADASSRFEHWLEGERMYLRERAVFAAWQVADREDSRGDADRASYWARRATELHATNEHSIRKLIELLGRQGDPRGAMRAYESFARRMAQEYQLAPARETVALIESLRQRNG